MFQGQSIRLAAIEIPGVFEMCFDRQGDVINKLDRRTLDELAHCVRLLEAQAGLRGVLITSAKDVFIVGADITEFGAKFKTPPEAIAEDVAHDNRTLIALEDLPAPSVAAINGFALGGGLELALAASWRAISDQAQVGLPEVRLGLFPGFGGTARIGRVAGPQVACAWVAGGRPSKAPAAQAAGVVDVVAPADGLRAAAIDCLLQCIDGRIDWAARQQRKRDPIALPKAELEAAYATALARVDRDSPPHQPAARMAVDMMAAGAGLTREAAIALESQAFGKVARTQAAVSMVQAFLSEQALKKSSKRYARSAAPVREAVVLGAGIMGGGIAYTSALNGISVRMKDLNQAALDLGMDEAFKQVSRLVKKGRLSQAKAEGVIAAIKPQVDDAGFDAADCVVEAIVENIDVKRRVLAELETRLKPGAVIASNTSSLRIDDIATDLKRPENFVGMHFFNPVHMMPLVEVIKGTRTSDAAVATAVTYAAAMGKTPIVVKDCPGFLVNRLLTAYMRAFLALVADGADFVRVDEAMESFGWPMGPAYLEDVIGMDTGSHVNDVISAGYPERMPPLVNDALRLMSRERRFGQKNGLGFYKYERDPDGKPRRCPAPDSHALLERVQADGPRDFTDAGIVDRMMLPMIVEAAHALEEGVVGTAAELDMALRLGLGFPAYAGGPLKYADWLGLGEVVARCNFLAHLGVAYTPTAQMRAMAAAGTRYHGA